MSIIASESFVITFTKRLHPDVVQNSLLTFSSLSENSSSDINSDSSRLITTSLTFFESSESSEWTSFTLILNIASPSSLDL